MNTGNIKKYAPKARTRFIETMTRQAARYGISSGHKGEDHVAPAEVRGDVLLISALDGQTYSFPKALRGPREALAKWVTQLGFEQVMEQAAYSWFNRLCAIRFMELKGYLDHGRRVLSHPDHDSGFQILDDCLEIDLPGLDAVRVRELKLDGTQDEALYRELLLAQCHALHEAMPFLFEPLDDASELLLPDNLTKTDSLIRELMEAIPEEDWQDVEVIGWLYQFYIAEKKDEVIGKVVKSEDIPAATQLFTPNWIVQYLVQNSVGRQWLQTYPDSSLKGHMPYYIEPAEQEPEVQAQLDAITPASIDPVTIKVLDPACGSGHILVEAYNVLKAIYEERGYRSRDIPKLVLENNLFGLDIDDRAAQLAGFALLMKAREDDRRIFSRGLRMNVLALQSTQHLDASALWRELNFTGDWHHGQSQSLFENEQKELSSDDNTFKTIVDLIERFQDAKTFGSLIEVPNSFEAPLKTLLDKLTDLADSGDTLQKAPASQLLPIVRQAWILAQRYEAVVANPPYMGARYYSVKLKKFIGVNYNKSRSDLYSCFMAQGANLLEENGRLGAITIPNWMFLSTFEEIRNWIVDRFTIESFCHNGRGVFGADFGSCAFVIKKEHFHSFKGSYKRLFSRQGSVAKNNTLNERFFSSGSYLSSSLDMRKIPGSPLAYWVSDKVREVFSRNPTMGEMVRTRQGLATGDNERFIRAWHEVDVKNIGFNFRNRDSAKQSEKKWFPHQKGGNFRKWYGNKEWVVNWHDDGSELRNFKDQNGKLRSRPQGMDCYFKECVSWSDVTSASNAFRYDGEGFIPNVIAPVAFKESVDVRLILLAGNNVFYNFISKALNPSIHFHVGYFSILPFPEKIKNIDLSLADELISLAKCDWDSREVSWDFEGLPWVLGTSYKLISESWGHWEGDRHEDFFRVKELEECNNKIFLDAYDLSDEFKADVDISEITISLADQGIDCVQLLSYGIGCMMGRYSLDKPGLILASQGETVRDYFAQLPETSFAPDKNAIIPLTDQEWFPDDATNRFRDFVRTVWSEEHLQENLDFVAESLCLHAIKPKKSEAALETIRRYLSTQFYKDHLRTYKKRPIYWLFSSGKQKAFECLVYLHRYNESTLAEMRTDYVIPLTTKLNGYVDKLEKNKENSTSAAEAKGIEQKLSKLYKQQAELNAFDEKLRHYADQRISLDLDDGVKVNYGKFGDLLAEVKQVTGEKAG